MKGRIVWIRNHQYTAKSAQALPKPKLSGQSHITIVKMRMKEDEGEEAEAA